MAYEDEDDHARVEQAKKDAADMGAKLATQATLHRKLDKYYEGRCPLPKAVVNAKVTKAYKMLMPMAEGPWGSLIVDSVEDRLQLTGINTGDKALNKALMEVWHANQMEAEAGLGHNSALVSGRAYATVWLDENDRPEIILDSAEQVIIKYAEGSRRRRLAAFRYWTEGDHSYCAVTYPDYIFKFRGKKGGTIGGTKWERYQPPEDEEWPLENPFGKVNVVELPVNRRLKPGCYPYARGEYEHCLGLIDRVHLLTFLGLVVAFYMGFPLRGVVGEKITRRVLVDDEGEPIVGDDGKPTSEAVPPFDAHAGGVAQFENPNAKLIEFKAADRGNLSIYGELDQLASVTKTPRHYMPMDGGLANIAEPTIRAFEGGLNAKCVGHKGSLGGGWLDVQELVAIALDAELPATTTLEWADHESRSMAERADAASKLKDILPWQAIAERYLNAAGSDIERWTDQRASEAFTQLVTDAQDREASAV